MHQEWVDGAKDPEDAGCYIHSKDGDKTYAEVCFITAAVGFRSGDLYEPFKGNAEASIAEYHAAPLIRTQRGNPLDVAVDERLWGTLKI